MLIIHNFCFHIFAKAVDDNLHHLVCAFQLNSCAFGVIHLEYSFGKFRNAEILRHRLGRIFGDCRCGLNAVNTESAYLAVFVRVAHNIVIVAVPNKRIRAEGVGLAIVAQHLFLLGVVFKVCKLNLSAFVDGVVDAVHNVEGTLVVRLNPAFSVYVSFYIFALINTCKAVKLGNQFSAFLFGDKLG